jgi:hypothetical protein
MSDSIITDGSISITKNSIINAPVYERENMKSSDPHTRWRKIFSHSTILFAAGILILLPLIVGTSPLPPPYHQYRVTGTIERAGGGPKQNYVVSLVGKFAGFLPDSIIDISSFDSGTVDQCITDTSGYFYIDARAFAEADSISIKVSAADKEPFIAPRWLHPVASIVITGELNTQEPGCTGCSSVETASSPYVKGYLYMFETQRIVIPD